MTIRKKLTSTYLFIALLAAIVGLIGWNSTNKVVDKFTDALENQTEKIVRLENIKMLTFRIQMEILSYTALANELGELDDDDDDDDDGDENKEENFFDKEVEEFQEAMNEVRKELVLYQKFDVPANKEDLLSIEESLNEYSRLGEYILKSVSNEQKIENLKAVKGLEETEEGFLIAINSLLKRSYDHNKKDLLDSHKIAGQSKTQFIVLMLLTALIAAFLGSFIARKIDLALNKLKIVAESLGNGQYDTRFKITTNDEFDELGKVFNQMAENLEHAKIIKQQNKDLERLNKELKVKNDALDSFVYRVSHDLKAPVINIEGLLQLMQSNMHKESSPIVHQAITFINESLVKLKQTIFDLLEVSRIEQRLQDEVEKVELTQITEEVMGEIQTQIQATNAQINYDFSEISAIDFSRINLKSLFANLMTNAIKYRSLEKAPILHISATRQKNHLSISFQDNGLGIDLKRHREKMFQMFSRFHSHVEGSGVGLYIVNKLVTTAKGSIEIESEVGNGTCFTVKLPLSVIAS